MIALGVKMRLGRKVYVGLRRMTTGSRWVITHELEREEEEKNALLSSFIDYWT